MNDNCHVEPIQKMSATEAREDVQLALLSISGMGCPSCAGRVRNSLLLLDGVLDAYVDYTGGITQVAFDPEIKTLNNLLTAIASAGADGHQEYSARLLATALARLDRILAL